MTDTITDVRPTAGTRDVAVGDVPGRRIRVLMLIKGLSRGGAERLLVSWIRHADRSRFDFSVAYLVRSLDAYVGDLEREGVPVHCLDGGRGVGWLLRLRRLVRDERFDVVHVHSPYAAIGARLAFPRGRRGRGRRERGAHARRGVRLVYHEHSTWDALRRPTRLGSRLTIGRDDHVFAVSQAGRDSILALRTRPVEVLPNGIDLEGIARCGDAAGVRADLGIRPGDRVIGMVGSFKWQKGHATLLEAAALIRSRFPNVRFVLVGEGPLGAELRRHAERLGLADAVVFAGAREDAVCLMRAFEVVAIPSIREGFPLVLLEAMAIGVPVVASAVGGITEVVADGREALLVPPGDSNELAEAIGALLGEPRRRDSLSRAGSDRVRAFDIHNGIARMERVYAELCS